MLYIVRMNENDFSAILAESESEFRDDMTIAANELPIDNDTPLGQLYGDGEDNE